MIGKRTRGLTLKEIVFSDEKISRRTSSGFESKPACVGAEAFQGVTCQQKAGRITAVVARGHGQSWTMVSGAARIAISDAGPEAHVGQWRVAN